MGKEEVLKRLQEIGTLDDDVKRREVLTEVTEEVTSIYDQASQLTTDVENNKKEIEKLREANMKLFLKVGEVKTKEQRMEEEGIEKEKDPRKFEDLFNEKGMIK